MIAALRGRVLIRVRAFGLNRLELYLRLGLSQGVTSPRVPGVEAPGVVEQCPGGEFRAGQQVAALMGAWAGSPRVRGLDLRPRRPGDPVPQRPGLGHPRGRPRDAADLVRLLTTGLDARPGQSVLIRGGTSSVGLATAVLARQRGMTILSTTRNPGKAAW